MKYLLFFLLGFCAFVGAGFSVLNSWLPSDQKIKGCMVTSMYQVNLCPGSKEYVPLNQISSYLQKTIILTEDSNFYNHKGFDWNAIEKNARQGWESGVFKRGGSTITQQLAKNMFLSKDRTFIRKGLEAIITDKIERVLTKKEILERYLNIVEFGKNIFGIKAASKFYFQKTPKELNVAESAFLAMVLPNPVKYSSSYYKKSLTNFAYRRLHNIVESLFRYNRITQEEYDIATAQVSTFFQPDASLKDDDEVLEQEILNLDDSEPEQENEIIQEEPL